MPNDFQRVGNARPPQALNGRLIYRYIDSIDDKEDRKEAKHKNNNDKNKKANKGGRQVQNALTDQDNNEEDKPILNSNNNNNLTFTNDNNVNTVANRYNVHDGDLVEVDLFDNSTHV